MAIRLLPDYLINQICAGEIAERPASILKELIENSLDAGATNISVQVTDGGKNKITIIDDGSGMDRADLEKSILRHATSKLPGEDLFHINSFGFRGEALASISSVARLSITTAKDGDAWELVVEGARVKHLRPVAYVKGTKIEVRDLFFQTPARLKFLKTDRSEFMAVSEMLQRLSLAHPSVSFTLNDKLAFPATNDMKRRVAQVIGKEFVTHSLEVDIAKHDFELTGLISQPTYNKGNASGFYLFVNGRPIKDKMLFGVIRSAYQDVLAHDRYPVVCLFLDCLPEILDVNVHPAKTEVRFKDPHFVRGFLISSIKKVIGEARISNQIPDFGHAPSMSAPVFMPSNSNDGVVARENAFQFSHNVGQSRDEVVVENLQTFQHEIQLNDYPMGEARMQLFNTFILSQTSDGFYLVDQHAVHERIVLEKMKEADLKRQPLLIPEVLECGEKQAELLMKEQEALAKCGLIIDSLEDDKIMIKEMPAMLERVSPTMLVQKIADELEDHGTALSLENKIHHIQSTIACHGSIRSGYEMSIPEMNALLRQMEQTPRAGQCNHGRPTFHKITRGDLDKLFER